MRICASEDASDSSVYNFLPSYFIFIIFLAKTTVLGSTSFQPGIWIGVEYDEPLGKNNGTVQGVEYFKCRPNHGAFVRPTKVTVGDFPEEDLFNTDDELEEM